MNIFDSLTLPLDGQSLIEASAGTGKTYAIASLYLRFVIEKGLAPENILVVTFTEAATKELRDRIRKRISEARDFFADVAPSEDPFLRGLKSGGSGAWPGDALACNRLDAALRTFDGAAISTIHSFCSRMLQEFTFESGSLFDTELEADQNPLIKRLADDFWRRHFFAGEAPLLPLINGAPLIKSPEAVGEFTRKLVGVPDLEVLPCFDEETVKQTEKGCLETFGKVKSMWLKDADAVKSILLDEKTALARRGVYSLETLEKTFTEMDAFVTAGNPYLPFKGLESLTPELMAEKRKKGVEPTHKLFPLCRKLYDLIAARRLQLHWQAYESVRTGLPEAKRSRNIRFYNDLMVNLDHALSSPAGESLVMRIRSRFKAALIDEFQDTDQTQYRIFSMVFSGDDTALCLIGDPKQAIYNFRGADIYAYIDARGKVAEKSRFTMDKNWRSTPLMVSAVNHLFTWRGKDRPLVIKSLDYPPVTAARNDQPLELTEHDPSPLQLWHFTLGEKDKNDIALSRGRVRVSSATGEEIARLLADGATGKATIDGRPLVPSDIAVVVRSHPDATRIHDELAWRGIPSVMRSNSSIFESSEAKDLVAVLAAVAEPQRDVKIKHALVTAIGGWNGTAIAALADPGGDARWTEELAKFREYHELWREKGFMTMFRKLVELEGVKKRFLSGPNGERAVTNLLHCAEVIHAEESARGLGIDSLLNWFAGNVVTPPKGEEHQIRLESDEKAVKILTIHVSKGLEFPVVFCPFPWWGIYQRDELVVCHEDARRVADYGSDKYGDHRVAALQEELAEAARLLYVALTRAKYRCYVTWGKFNNAAKSAMTYLLHRPEITEGDVLEALGSAFKTLTDIEIREKLTSLQEGLPEGITITENPDGGETTYAAPVYGDAPLECRKFKGQLQSEWKVASFSSLSRGHSETAELPDRDEVQEGEPDETPVKAPEGSIFAFDRGPTAGTFLHSVFEEVDFMKVDEAAITTLVNDKLAEPGFKSIKGSATAVINMIGNVVRAQLPGGFRLCDLNSRSWVPEMEFFFPLRFINSDKVSLILRKFGVAGDRLSHLAAALDFNELCGMLTGSIDLVFCHEGRYYLLDWKSNHLGNTVSDYGPGRLGREMDKHLYVLQYLIYTVALNRHLMNKVPGYTYENAFGGAIYLFLRGIDPQKPGSGIYHDLPDAALISELTRCLIECEGI